MNCYIYKGKIYSVETLDKILRSEFKDIRQNDNASIIVPQYIGKYKSQARIKIDSNQLRDIQLLAQKLNVETSGFTSSSSLISFKIFESEAMKLGYGAKESRSGSFYFTKNGVFFNPYDYKQIKLDSESEFIAWIKDKFNNKQVKDIVNPLIKLTEHKVNTQVRNITSKMMSKIATKHGVILNFFDKSIPSMSGKNVIGYYKDGTVNYHSNDITLDTYIHEFSHLWLRVIKNINNRLYKSILNKTETFLNGTGKLAKLINDRTSHLSSEERLEEASAILSGIVNIPSLLKYVGNDLSIDNLNKDEILDMLGEELAQMYNVVNGELNIQSLADIDLQNATLYEILLGLGKDIMEGNNNPFEMFGNTVEGLRKIGMLDGYAENESAVSNTILTSGDLVAGLTDSVMEKRSIQSMLDRSDKTELYNWIDSRANSFITNKVGDKALWMMQGLNIDIDLVDGRLTSESKEEVIKMLRELPNNTVNMWQEVFSSFRTNANRGQRVEEMIHNHTMLQTRYGNSKYSMDNAKLIADIVGFSSAIEGIYTLEQFASNNRHIIGDIDLNMFKGLNPMIVVHKGLTSATDEVHISLFAIERMYNHITGKIDSNLFANLTGLTDAQAVEKGLTLKQNTADLTNIQLGILAGHLNNKLKKLRIKSIGTLDMSSNFKAKLIPVDQLFRNIGYIKEATELYDTINNEEIKTIIDKASLGEYNNLKQSYYDELKTFYYDSLFYSDPDNAILSRYNQKFFEMKYDEQLDFIDNRLRQMQQRDSNAYKNSYEFQLLSKVRNETVIDGNHLNISATDTNALKTNLSSPHAFLTETYNHPNVIVETAIQTIIKNENRAVAILRTKQEKFQELLNKVWLSRGTKVTAQDVASERLQHMFVQTEINGQKKTLPFIWHNNSEFFNNKKLFPGMTKQQIINKFGLTEADLALGDHIVESFEQSFIEAEMVNIMNNTILAKDKRELLDDNKKLLKSKALETIQKKGWNKNSGQVFILSKSLSELAKGRQFKALGERIVQQSTEVNMGFTNRIVGIKIDTFRNSLVNQLNHKELLAMAGLAYDGTDVNNPGFVITDDTGKLNDKMSRNLEDIFNYTVYANARQELHAKESDIQYKAALAHLHSLKALLDTDQGENLQLSIDYLNKYYEAIVMNKKLPEAYLLSINVGVGGKKFNVGNTVDIMGRTSSYIFLAFSPKIALKSAFFNTTKMALFGLGNLMANTSLPDIRHFTEAHKEYLANAERARAWGRHYQVANASMYEVLNSSFQNVTKKYVLNDQVGHAMNQYTDEVARHITMIAFMLKEGSWDAHTYNIDKNGNEKLVYDEKKDKRLYRDGVLTEEGKAIKRGIKDDLIRDGVMTEQDDVLRYGYDMQDAITMKAIADKWIIGAYSNSYGAQANNTQIGRQLSKFRRFFLSVIGNMFMTAKKESVMISFRKVMKDEEGNYISKREALEIVSSIQTFIKYGIMISRWMSGKNTDKLSEMEKATLWRGLTSVGLLGLLYFLFGKFRDDDEKREYFIDLYDLYRDQMIYQQLGEVGETPLPTISSWQRLIGKGIDNPLNLLFYMPPVGRVSNELNNIINFINSEEYEADKRAAAKEKREEKKLEKLGK
jgi:hypothetical protein